MDKKREKNKTESLINQKDRGNPPKKSTSGFSLSLTYQFSIASIPAHDKEQYKLLDFKLYLPIIHGKLIKTTPLSSIDLTKVNLQQSGERDFDKKREAVDT